MAGEFSFLNRVFNMVWGARFFSRVRGVYPSIWGPSQRARGSFLAYGGFTPLFGVPRREREVLLECPGDYPSLEGYPNSGCLALLMVLMMSNVFSSRGL